MSRGYRESVASVSRVGYLTTRADKEFYSAHRASSSLRHSVCCAHLPYLHVPKQFSNQFPALSLMLP